MFRIKSLFVIISLTAAVAVTSCSKTPQADDKEPAGTPSAETAAKEAEKAAESESTGMQAINLLLPKPMFVGTPQNLKVTNLEKPLGKARSAFLAPAGTSNLALNQEVTSSDMEPIIGEVEMITDGDKSGGDGSFVELGPGVQYVTIDLGQKARIYAVVVWHFHKQARVYNDVVVQVADDVDFISDVKTIFNNDHDNSAGLVIGSDKNYIETYEGKLIDAGGVEGRYVRLYSNGSTSNDLNHYVEVEVYGRAAE